MTKLPQLDNGRRNPGIPHREAQPYSARNLGKHSRLRGATVSHSVCPYCAVGCGTNIYTKEGRVIDIEGNPDSPISEGCLCPKGANIFQLSVNAHREKRVMYRAPYSDRWEYKSLDWAMDRIAQRIRETREEGFKKKTEDGMKLNHVINMGTLGGAALDNEENYLIKKLFCGGLGIVSIENQARICHSASVPGLGAAVGRGAAMGYLQDLANSDCIIIMGSDMAEAHPVGFRWPMKAKEHGAKLIHIDPRFTRTSAKCDLHVTIRAGSDIAFLGGLINYILVHDKWFKEYVTAYTNASTIIEDGFQDTEDLDGVFSGWNQEKEEYSPSKGHWGYEKGGVEKLIDFLTPTKDSGSGTSSGGHGMHGPASMGGASAHTSKRSATTKEPGGQPPRDETFEHPRCVLQLLRKHYARYTPEMVSEICGCTPEQLITVAETLCANSGRERTSAFVYAVGWTQHSVGVQMIYAAALIQLLLGNVGRPGSGVLPLRGHCSIQGSTDIPTLYDMLPSYLAQPLAEKHHETLDGYVDYESFPTGWWSNYRKFIVSLLKAWYGEAATKDNDFHFDWVPRIDDDYSQLPFFDRMSKGKVKGYLIFGQNPAGGGPNANLHRAGLRNLDWLVVTDWFQTETATFWKNDPKGPSPGDIKTEVFFLPAAPITAKEGSFTNTQRLVQFHDKAVDPEQDCRSDLWYVYNLGRKLKLLYANSTDPKDDPIKNLTWDYGYDKTPILPDGRPSRIDFEPDANKVMREVNGWHVDDIDPANGKPKQLSSFQDLKDDGSTACGSWLYCGIFPEYGRNRSREREIGSNPLQPRWAWAWPHNRRIMYNRASADPEGKPWSERKKLVWWDAEKKQWVGFDEPDFELHKPPDYKPHPWSKGMDAIGGAEPFIMKPDGRGWVYTLALKDGPMPTHYEPVESPVSNRLYPEHNVNPTERTFDGPLNPICHTPSKEFPIVACTFRLTEHYLSGPMSRFNSWLNELQPAMFVELSPELAKEKGIEHGGWATIRSPRGEIEARAMVTRRIVSPLQIDGQMVHQIGLPFHWAYAGETVGANTNDLTALTADPNVSIHEAKVFAVDIRAGRTAGLPPRPTVPMARYASRDHIPQTAAAAQPEGHMK